MDEILSRQMPHSVEAEQAVLGSMLIDSRCIPTVVGMLTAEDFYVQLNREIYATVYSMFNYSRVIDPVTILEQMKADGLGGNRDLASYLFELMNITPTAANVVSYAKILKDKSLLRGIADAGSAINDMAMEGIDEAEHILEASEKRIYDLRSGRAEKGLEPISRVLVGVYDQIEEASKRDNAVPGLTTGFSTLDAAIMGMNGGDLILIASRPGMGKTSVALNIVRHAARSSGKTVAVFSLEMSREQLGMRLLSSESLVDNKKLQTGRLSDDDWDRITEAGQSLGGMKLLISDNPLVTVADMNAQCRRVKDLGLVVVDYLQLMTSAGSNTTFSSENRTQVVSEISRMLKIMAKDMNVPVLCLSQLSRANEGRSDKRPMLSDLRESGAIEQDADVVIGLYRDDYYNKNSDVPGVAEFIILKNRRGETGTLQMHWEPQYTTFTPLETRYED